MCQNIFYLPSDKMNKHVRLVSQHKIKRIKTLPESVKHTANSALIKKNEID